MGSSAGYDYIMEFWMLSIVLGILCRFDTIVVILLIISNVFAYIMERSRRCEYVTPDPKKNDCST